MISIENSKIIYETSEKHELKSIRKQSAKIGFGLISFKVLTILASIAGTYFLVSKGLFDKNIESNFEGFDPIYYYLLTIFITIVSLGLPLIFLLIFSRERPKNIIKFKFGKYSIFLIGLGLGGCIIANIIANSISNITERLGYPLPSGPVYYNGQPLIAGLMVVSNCLLPAFLEELLFRGFILGNLRKYGEFPALLISSLAFAFMHGTFLQMPFALLSGLVLGFIYLKSNSILPSIIVHFLNNSLSVIAILLMTHTSKSFGNLCYSLIFVVIVLFWVISIIILKEKNIFNFDYSKDQRIRLGLFFKTYVFSFGTFLLLACIAYNIEQILVR